MYTLESEPDGSRDGFRLAFAGSFEEIIDHIKTDGSIYNDYLMTRWTGTSDIQDCDQVLFYATDDWEQEVRKYFKIKD